MSAFVRNYCVAMLIVLVTVLGYAGNTGKIVGKVVDEKGEGLPGVNVKVVSTNRGAVTDPDGKFTIIGVPVGEYTVQASAIGYQPMSIQGVKVQADMTVSTDFKLGSSSVNVHEVIITADKMVNNLVTSAGVEVSQKTIESIPNVKDVQDVIKLQAGVVKQGNNLFLRGGRANEVQYLVDGVPSNNIVSNSGITASTGGNANAQLAQLYAGQSNGVIGGGAGGLSVSANTIQSVSVQSSGFDADYGNAQSGIVSIATKSGSEKYSVSAQFRTDKISSQNQNENYSAFSFGGPEPITKYLLPAMGLSIPGALTFFVSSDADRADGAYNFSHNSYYNPLRRRIQLNGFLGGLLNGTGFNFMDNQKNSFTLTSKVRYDPSSADQIIYRYSASLGTNHDLVNAWKYRADSSNVKLSLSTQHAFSWQHFFGANTFLKVILGKSENRNGNDVAGLAPTSYVPVHDNLQPSGTGYNLLGMDQEWYSGNTNVWSARLDFNSQVHQYHLLKAGFEFYYEEINSTEIQYPMDPNTDSTSDFSRGLFPGIGLYRWNLNNYPNHGAAFIQDNIEFSGLNFHVGLRYDYFDLGKQIFYYDFYDRWQKVSQMAPQWVQNAPDGDNFKYYLLHGYFSPRLSIGYPVTDKIVFYFNYGHFYQFPDRDQYYRDPFVVKTNSWFGNPDLKPQKTVNYEAGFEDQFTDDMAFSIHAFYKDIFDYATLVLLNSEYIYFNLDYASARGFEFSFQQALSGNLSASASYSYQIAKGRSSNPQASQFNPEYQLPRETRLDWDQNHTLNLFASYRVGANQPGEFFGLPFVNNYGMSLTYTFGSGFPFTPYYGQRTDSRNVYLHNNETRPYTATVNLTLYKGFQISDQLNLTASLDITNILNRQNIAVGTQDLGFNQTTGQPNHFGDSDPTSNFIYPYSQTDSRIPAYLFDPPRQILLGVRLSWE